MAQRDYTITWQGESYTFSPAFRFLRSLDAKLQSDRERPTNLVQVAFTMHSGGRAMMDIPVVWAACLNSAGVDATEDDCWAAVSAVASEGATQVQKDDYQSFYLALAGAIAPSVDLGKPPARQEEKAPSRKRKKTAA
jgi:hypothetical protein